MFNKDENQNYVGPIPCKNDYGVDFMKPGERDAFIAWHDEQVANNYRYDFREEIIKYCRSDVDILRKCCLLYREMFRDETDIDPFNKALTIASYCQEVYLTNFLKKDTIAVFNNHRQLKTKQSNDAVMWLSYISEKEDLYIKHVRNGGEKRFQCYSWMVTVKKPIRPMNIKAVISTVRGVDLIINLILDCSECYDTH